MLKFISQFIFLCAVFLVANPLHANSKFVDPTQINQTYVIEEVLAQINDIIQSSDYSEQLYYISTENGIYRFLFVHNPQYNEIQRGIMTMNSRYIFGFDNDCSDELLNAVENYIDENELRSFTCAAIINGKTIIQLFGY